MFTPPSNMSPAIALVFEAMAVVARDPAVLQAIEKDPASSASIMEAMAIQLNSIGLDAKIELALVKTSKRPQKNHLDLIPVAFAFYLRADDWFLAPVRDPALVPAAQSEWGFVALDGEASALNYERLRFSALVGQSFHLEHEILNATKNPWRNKSGALLANILNPLLAGRAKQAMDHETAPATPATPSAPRI